MTNVVKLPAAVPDLFEEFWQAYPRRIGKALARAKWKAITGPGLKTRTLDKDSGTYVEIELRATPDEIIAGAKRYYQANRLNGTGQYGFKDGGRYLCQPAYWLNRGRWEDE